MDVAKKRKRPDALAKLTARVSEFELATKYTRQIPDSIELDHTPEEEAALLRSIEESKRNRGRGRPVEEVMEDFREKFAEPPHGAAPHPQPLSSKAGRGEPAKRRRS
jgi:hypothetical protein